jgi:MFS family permease
MTLNSEKQPARDNMPTSERGLRQTFRALSYPNYRLWFIGQAISLFGTWMQSTALGFLVYELTHSPVYLGYVAFATGVPTWLFTLLGGVASDRIARRTLLIITQNCMMVLAFILAGLTYFGLIQPWQIIIMAFLLGIANAFDAPARLALAPELVERKDLTNAIALNATMFNIATIVGPAAAALVYAYLGPSWCFFLNGLSFVAVIIALIAMKLPEQMENIRRLAAIKELKVGIHYVFLEKTVLSLIIIIGVSSLFGFSFITLLPAWSVEVLGGDVKTNGLLNSARGIGALIAALGIASMGRSILRGRILTIGTFVTPVLLFIFSFILWLPLSLLVIMGIGGGLILIVNLINSLIQTRVSDELRGRVMSIYSLTFFGSMSIGSLIIGEVADFFNEQTALRIGSVALLLCAFIFWFYVPTIRKLP